MRMKVVKQTGGSRKNGWDVEKLNHTRHNDEYKKQMRKKLIRNPRRRSRHR
jgi:hypothetical protein